VKISFFLQISWRQHIYTDQQKTKYMLWYEFYESFAAVRRKFRTFYHVYYHQTPRENALLRWSQKFKETGSLVLQPTQY
jgi:hypothetical protein